LPKRTKGPAKARMVTVCITGKDIKVYPGDLTKTGRAKR
jgi:hypothetical protein